MADTGTANPTLDTPIARKNIKLVTPEGEVLFQTSASIPELQKSTGTPAASAPVREAGAPYDITQEFSNANTASYGSPGMLPETAISETSLSPLPDIPASARKVTVIKTDGELLFQIPGAMLSPQKPADTKIADSPAAESAVFAIVPVEPRKKAEGKSFKSRMLAAAATLTTLMTGTGWATPVSAPMPKPQSEVDAAKTELQATALQESIVKEITAIPLTGELLSKLPVTKENMDVVISAQLARGDFPEVPAVDIKTKYGPATPVPVAALPLQPSQAELAAILPKAEVHAQSGGNGEKVRTPSYAKQPRAHTYIKGEGIQRQERHHFNKIPPTDADDIQPPPRPVPQQIRDKKSHPHPDKVKEEHHGKTTVPSANDIKKQGQEELKRKLKQSRPPIAPEAPSNLPDENQDLVRSTPERDRISVILQKGKLVRDGDNFRFSEKLSNEKQTANPEKGIS